jgi:serine/threonine protein kinase
MFFEFANATDLENLKIARKRFSEQEAWIILKQLISAFQELYKRELIHRDLKLANVLIHFPDFPIEIPEEYQEDMSARLEYLKSFLGQVDLFNNHFEVKLADFGFAK